MKWLSNRARHIKMMEKPQVQWQLLPYRLSYPEEVGIAIVLESDRLSWTLPILGWVRDLPATPSPTTALGISPLMVLTVLKCNC